LLPCGCPSDDRDALAAPRWDRSPSWTSACGPPLSLRRRHPRLPMRSRSRSTAPRPRRARRAERRAGLSFLHGAHDLPQRPQPPAQYAHVTPARQCAIPYDAFKGQTCRRRALFYWRQYEDVYRCHKEAFPGSLSRGPWGGDCPAPPLSPSSNFRRPNMGMNSVPLKGVPFC
ncbi:hypothetical protein GGX14DRAFT_610385, partial [Mycena pura]